MITGHQNRGRHGATAAVCWQAVKYLTASLMALAVDLLIYAVLLSAGIMASAAGGLGYCGGLLVNYTISVQWVFKDRMTAPAGMRVFAKFALSGVAGLSLTAAVIGTLTGYAVCGNYAAKWVAVAVSYLTLFLLRRNYVFRPAWAGGC